MLARRGAAPASRPRLGWRWPPSACWLAVVVLGVDPVFSVVTALPGFRTAHNGRMVILVLSSWRMLAGWGLDDLIGSRDRLAAVDAPWRSALRSAIFASRSSGWRLTGQLEPGRLGAALDVAWGFADPPRVRPGRQPIARTVDVVRMSAL